MSIYRDRVFYNYASCQNKFVHFPICIDRNQILEDLCCDFELNLIILCLLYRECFEFTNLIKEIYRYDNQRPCIFLEYFVLNLVHDKVRGLLLIMLIQFWKKRYIVFLEMYFDSNHLLVYFNCVQWYYIYLLSYFLEIEIFAEMNTGCTFWRQSFRIEVLTAAWFFCHLLLIEMY